jgi:hypothetical protein
MRYLALLSAVALATPATLSAATINVLADNRIDDVPTYGSNAGSTDAVPAATQLFVGDSSDNNKTFASILEFAIDADRAEIAAATAITLTVPVTNKLGTPRDMSLYVLDDAASNGSVTISDIAGGSLISNFTAGSVSTSAPLVVDVTAQVKALAAIATNNHAAFRIQLQTLAIGGTGADLVEFTNGGATLTVVPEPTALLSAGLVGMLAMRRRVR